MGWPTARACRSGEESQQPTCPQVRHGRKCTHSVPSRRHSSHPFGVCGYTCRIMLGWGSLTVDVGVLAVSLPLRISSCSPGDAGRTSSDQLVHCWDVAPASRTGDVGRAGVRQAGAFAMPRFTYRKVIPIGATARVVAQGAPETLTLAGTELSRPRRPSPGCP